MSKITAVNRRVHSLWGFERNGDLSPIGSPVALCVGQSTGSDHRAELLQSLCAVSYSAAPREAYISMRIGLERHYVIAVCETATFVMQKPRIAQNPGKHEASPRQRSINYVI